MHPSQGHTLSRTMRTKIGERGWWWSSREVMKDVIIHSSLLLLISAITEHHRCSEEAVNCFFTLFNFFCVCLSTLCSKCDPDANRYPTFSFACAPSCCCGNRAWEPRGLGGAGEERREDETSVRVFKCRHSGRTLTPYKGHYTDWYSFPADFLLLLSLLAWIEPNQPKLKQHTPQLD